MGRRLLVVVGAAHVAAAELARLSQELDAEVVREDDPRLTDLAVVGAAELPRLREVEPHEYRLSAEKPMRVVEPYVARPPRDYPTLKQLHQQQRQGQRGKRRGK